VTKKVREKASKTKWREKSAIRSIRFFSAGQREEMGQLLKESNSFESLTKNATGSEKDFKGGWGGGRRTKKHETAN